jgi:hypothetical protein
MHVDLPSPTEVRSLLEVTGYGVRLGPMPATPQSDDAAVEWIVENLASQAIAKLKAVCLDKHVITHA